MTGKKQKDSMLIQEMGRKFNNHGQCQSLFTFACIYCVAQHVQMKLPNQDFYKPCRN